MHNPHLWMLLRILPEDRERFFVALFAHQLTTIAVHLLRAGKFQRLFLRHGRVVFTIERRQYLCFRVLVVEAVFIFDGLIGINQRAIQVDFLRQQVVRRIVPALPRVLR